MFVGLNNNLNKKKTKKFAYKKVYFFIKKIFYTKTYPDSNRCRLTFILLKKKLI